MQALTLHGPGKIRCESVPDPSIVAPTDAIVRVELAGLCGSDLHPYRGHERGLDDGTVMGHELVGRVVEVGAEVERFATDVRVVSPFTTSCGTCRFCSEGLTSRCSSGELLGWVEGGRGLHGAQAEYVRVPLADTTLVEVPADARGEEVLLVGDVLATGTFCAESGGVGPGRSVAILGCGPVGLMAAVAARELGATDIFALDTLAPRLELAERLGARPVELAPGDAAATRRAFAPEGVDVVLEAVGSPEASRLAFELVRPGGTISAVGVHTESHFAFSPGDAYDKNLTYRAGRCPARRFMEPLLPLVLERHYDLSAIVSHRMALDEGVRAYDLFDRKLEGCTKVVLVP